VTRRESAAALLVAAALAVLMTWPVAGRFGSAGRVDSGDGRYSIWNIAWVAHALSTQPSRVFDANIFDPSPHTLAYSESNLVAGVIGLPVWALTGNPYATSNFVTLVAFTLAAFFAYALVRHLRGSRTGAAFTAITFAFCPFLYSHLAHVQLLMTFGLPLILLQLHRFVAVPSFGRAMGLGAAMALQALGCGYYGVFGGLAAGFGVLWFGIAQRRLRDWRYWGLGLAAAALAGAIVAPFFAPYADIQAEGFGRSLDEARRYSAGWRAYLASAGLLHRWMLPWLETWREVLFPGFLPVALGLAGLALAWRERGVSQADMPHRHAVLGFYAALVVLAVWASTGPNGGLYLALHELLPFFALLRAPARFALLATLALAVLGGLAASRLQRLVPAGHQTAVIVAFIGLTLADSTVGPLPMVDAPPVPGAVTRLARLPRAPVAEFPYFADAGDRHRHTEYMLMSTLHWQPLVNGYSDHFPPTAAADMQALRTFPSAEAWSALRAHGVRYVVMHWRLYDRDDLTELVPAIAALAPYLRLIVEDSGVSLFEVVRWPDGSDADGLQPPQAFLRQPEGLVLLAETEPDLLPA
jgi:hypothetical protein